MGLFTYLCGRLVCIRCHADADRCFQTKLLRVTPENSYREYRAGSRVVVDGLGDYWPLHPPPPDGPLQVLAGDWDCGTCGLNYQWARVVLEPDWPSKGPDVARPEFPDAFPAVISTVETFVADTEQAFFGIH